MRRLVFALLMSVSVQMSVRADDLDKRLIKMLDEYGVEQIDNPPQDPNQEFRSMLMYIVERDQPVLMKSIHVRLPDSETNDADGDGVVDGLDAFPNDPAASVDSDGDGQPDDIC